MDLPDHIVKKFKLCRLFKQIHFVTDLLDSKQVRLIDNILRPTSTFNKIEKFPNIEVPKSYWQHWNAII